MLKLCAFCNKDFIPKYSKQKFCSPSCSSASKKKQITKTCSFCNKTYSIKKSLSLSSNYCSKECSVAGSRKTITLFCAVCSKSFSLKPSIALNQHCCSKKCGHIFRQRRVTKRCLWCDEEFIVVKARENSANFCSHNHKGLYFKCKKLGTPHLNLNLKEFVLDRNLSYLIGIISSDGTLHKRRKLIKLCSKDFDYLEMLRDLIATNITGFTNKIQTETKKMNGHICTFHTYSFSHQYFYDFCVSLGLTPNKSLSIAELKIPPQYFFHFLRGVIDGDGNYNILKSRNLQVRLFSGSLSFLEWIKSELSVYGINTNIRSCHNNCSMLHCTNRASINKLIHNLYLDSKNLCLQRKYIKISDFINSSEFYSF